MSRYLNIREVGELEQVGEVVVQRVVSPRAPRERPQPAPRHAAPAQRVHQVAALLLLLSAKSPHLNQNRHHNEHILNVSVSVSHLLLDFGGVASRVILHSKVS